MQRILVALFAVPLLLLPLHPFLSTWLTSLAPPQAGFVISAWKELILSLAAMLGLLWLLWRGEGLRWRVLDVLIIAFVLLSLLSGVLFTGDGYPQNLAQVVWGAKYGLFFFVIFAIVRQLRFSPQQKRFLVGCALVPAALVIGFGFVQKVILPETFLIPFGYNSEYGITEAGQGLSYCHKIENRITHEEFCRAQSTLSGPNQFGAYLLIVLPLLLFLAPVQRSVWLRTLLTVVLVFGVATLFFTWSRSAWIGMLAAMAMLFIITATRPGVAIAYLTTFGLGVLALFAPALAIEHWDELKPIALTAAVAALVVLCIFLLRNWPRRDFPRVPALVFPFFLGGLVAVRAFFDTFFWNIILRPSSTQGHWERWGDGVYYMLQYPWGLGLGDAGPASARFARPGETGFLPESWYLQVGLESGVLGLLLFLAIIVLVGLELYRRHTPTAHALLLALIGISTACLFLHSWESAAVALTFWLLAGIELAREDKPSLAMRVRNFFSRFF